MELLKDKYLVNLQKNFIFTLDPFLLQTHHTPKVYNLIYYQFYKYYSK